MLFCPFKSEASALGHLGRQEYGQGLLLPWASGALNNVSFLLAIDAGIVSFGEIVL